MEQSKPLSGDHKDFDNFKQKIGKHYGSEVVFNETGVRDEPRLMHAGLGVGTSI